jgi:hypothetical protein
MFTVQYIRSSWLVRSSWGAQNKFVVHDVGVKIIFHNQFISSSYFVTHSWHSSQFMLAVDLLFMLTSMDAPCVRPDDAYSSSSHRHASTLRGGVKGRRACNVWRLSTITTSPWNAIMCSAGIIMSSDGILMHSVSITMSSVGIIMSSDGILMYSVGIIMY